MRDAKCVSCNKSIDNDRYAATFKCPKCRKEELVRCGKCRKTSVEYTCKCGFAGP